MSELKKQSALSLAAYAKYGEIEDTQLQELASLVTMSDKVLGTAGETYLRTMLTRMQSLAMGGVSGVAASLDVLEKVEAPMYEAVKRGSLTADIVINPMVDDQAQRKRKVLEHNRRCNWARSIKSELKGALKAGVELMSLPAQTTTKTMLRVRKTEAIEAGVGLPKRGPLIDAVLAIARAHKFIKDTKLEGTNTMVLVPAIEGLLTLVKET